MRVQPPEGAGTRSAIPASRAEARISSTDSSASLTDSNRNGASEGDTSKRSPRRSRIRARSSATRAFVSATNSCCPCVCAHRSRGGAHRPGTSRGGESVPGVAGPDGIAHPDAGETESLRQRACDDDALTARQRLLVGKPRKLRRPQCRPSRETVVGEGPERRRVGRFAGRIVRVADDGERMTVRVGGQQVVVWDELRRPVLEPDLAGVLTETGIRDEHAVAGPDRRLDRRRIASRPPAVGITVPVRSRQRTPRPPGTRGVSAGYERAASNASRYVFAASGGTRGFVFALTSCWSGSSLLPCGTLPSGPMASSAPLPPLARKPSTESGSIDGGYGGRCGEGFAAFGLRPTSLQPLLSHARVSERVDVDRDASVPREPGVVGAVADDVDACRRDLPTSVVERRVVAHAEGTLQRSRDQDRQRAPVVLVENTVNISPSSSGRSAATVSTGWESRSSFSAALRSATYPSPGVSMRERQTYAFPVRLATCGGTSFDGTIFERTDDTADHGTHAERTSGYSTLGRAASRDRHTSRERPREHPPVDERYRPDATEQRPHGDADVERDGAREFVDRAEGVAADAAQSLVGPV